MGKQVASKGIVLHEMPMSDQDKRLVVLTKEFGKITVFVRGARKATSPHLAGSQIFAYGEFNLYSGKNSYNLQQVQLIEPFFKLRENIEKMTYGLYLLEFSSGILEEEQSNPEVLYLLLKALKHLERHEEQAPLIRLIYELRSLAYLGVSPLVTQCTICGRKEALIGFNGQEGGTICSVCFPRYPLSVRMSESTRYTIQYVLSAEVEQLFTFRVDPFILEELSKLMKIWCQIHVGKTFKTMEFLKNNS